MLKSKGTDPKNWNWQMRDDRVTEELEEENDYLTNVEKISH